MGKRSQSAMVIYLDIHGAFDNSGFPHIIKSLCENNLPNHYTHIIKNFPINRKATIYINNESITRTPETGTPQGSILSPLLWNILINKILKIPTHHTATVQAYADDIAIIVSNKDEIKLKWTANETLKSIHKMLLSMNLQLNLSKTNKGSIPSVTPKSC